MKINDQSTYVAINKHGNEVNVPGSLVKDILKKDMVIVAEIVDGERKDFVEALTQRPVAKKIFSEGWNKKEEEKPEEVPEGEKALEEERLYCVTCGFTSEHRAGFLKHVKSHSN